MGGQRQAMTGLCEFPVMCLTKKCPCVTLLDNNNCETYTTHNYIYLEIYANRVSKVNCLPHNIILLIHTYRIVADTV